MRPNIFFFFFFFDPCANQQDTAIDISIVTPNLANAKWEVIGDTNSDHLPIEITLKDNYTPNKLVEKPKFYYNKANWVAFQVEMEEIKMNNIEHENIDVFADNLTKEILLIAVKHIVATG